MGLRLNPACIYQSFRFCHPDLGIVSVTVRRNARHITARLSSVGQVKVSVPPGASVASIDEILTRLKNRTKEIPVGESGLYSHGMAVDCGEFRFIIDHTSHTGGAVKLVTKHKRPKGKMTIQVDADADIDSPDVQAAISSLMMRVAAYATRIYLIPYAMGIACELGCTPKGWDVGYGRKTLGTCSSRGIIRLSGAVMFLPEHLRRYIICHELAHLTHMDHSAHFHTLCNVFCHGREKELVAELKRFKWPIIR
ncbi:MAG: M48 family metallopeptidase [Muribaculaceae bacterium]|nr:M48 family metallopeptidase [Muribaculaceae bacterium]